MAALWVQNLAAHWLQACLLCCGATAVAAALGLKHPRIRLVFWQAVFALTLLLPLLQPWRSPAILPVPSQQVARIDSVARVVGAGNATASTWPSAILLVAGAGVVLRLGWIALGLVRLRQLRRLPPIEAGSFTEIDAAMRDLGVAASVRLSERDGPLNFGTAHPVVVVPASLSTLTSEARFAVALHELVHVRRRDCVTALGEEVLLALFWFHPWSWWIRAQICLAREETVDREVVARLGGREAYAICLLSVAGHDLSGIRAGVALLRRRELRLRLDALFQEVAMSPARLVATVGLLGTALTGVAVGAASLFPLTTLASTANELIQAAGTRRVLQLVPPQYPDQMQDEGVAGTVAVEVTVNAAGDVSGFNVVDGPAALRDATITAVRQWKFERARTADVLVVDVGYQLTRRGSRLVPGWSFTVREREAELPAPVRVGGDVKPPKVVKEVRAIYPPDALTAAIQGIVHMEATIGTDGKVSAVKVIQSVPELEAAAVEAIRQWEFEPGTVKGVVTPVIVQLTVQFKVR